MTVFLLSRRRSTSQSYRMAPTGVPSDVCTGTLHCGAGSYTAGTMATPHSDELALTQEKEDHQPFKVKIASPRKRLGEENGSLFSTTLALVNNFDGIS